MNQLNNGRPLEQFETRRGFLKALALLTASAAVPGVGAQSLIEQADSVGYGAAPASRAYVASPYMSNARALELANQAQPQQSAQAPIARTPTGQVINMDWRNYLLRGERSILMRREGALRKVRYCTADGHLDTDGYRVACHMLRDVRADKMVAIDPSLLDILCGIEKWMAYYGYEAIYEITSGYRSPQTNLNTEGAAKNSMHLYGKAADVVISGATTSMVGEMARQFNRTGGNGIYLSKKFVHVDTGPQRTWVSGTAQRR